MRLAASTRVTPEPVHGQTAATIDGSGFSFGPKVAIGIIVWALMSLAAAFHWFGTSVDYFNYISFYNGIPYELSAGDSRFEGGFVLISWFYKYILGADYDILALSVIAAALAIKFYLFFRYLKSPLLAIIVYLMIFYPLYEYTQIRAALAGALAYFSINSFMDRKYYSASALILGAIVFHVSAVILLIAVAAFVVIKRPAGVVVVFVGLLALMIWYEDIAAMISGALPLINPLAIRYLDNTSSAVIPNLWSVQNLFLLSSMILLALSNDKDRNNFEYLFMFLSISGFVALIIFINSPVLAQRSKELLTVSTIFLVFRGRVGPIRNAPFALMLLGGAWSVYRAVSQGVLGG